MKSILKKHIDKILLKLDYKTLMKYIPSNYNVNGKSKNEIMYIVKQNCLKNDNILIKLYNDNIKKIALTPKEVDYILQTSPLDRQDLVDTGILTIIGYNEFTTHDTKQVIKYPLYDFISVYKINSSIIKDTKEIIKLKNDLNKFENIVNTLDKNLIPIFDLTYFIWRISKIRLNYKYKLKNARTKMFDYESAIDKWSYLEAEGLYLLYKKNTKIVKITKQINTKNSIDNKYCFSIKFCNNMVLHLILEEKYCIKFPSIDKIDYNKNYFYEKLYIFNIDNFKFNISDISEEKIEEMFWNAYHMIDK